MQATEAAEGVAEGINAVSNVRNDIAVKYATLKRIFCGKKRENHLYNKAFILKNDINPLMPLYDPKLRITLQIVLWAAVTNPDKKYQLLPCDTNYQLQPENTVKQILETMPT
jgi:hypothetical protein